jgi:hypothetical protein
MSQIPIYDDTAPIVCTAASDEISKRIGQIEAMRDNVQRLERTPDGLLLHFPDRPDIDAELQRFTVEEKGCCQFWGFEIATVGDDLTLRWAGPPDTAEFMDRLHAFFDGDEPLTEASGLL